MSDMFRCAQCGGVFEKAWTDEEAQAEFAENFAEHSLDDAALVCDECYKALTRGEL